MNIDLLEKEALYQSEGLGESSDDKYQHHPKIKGWYYFPEDEELPLILVVEMIPDLVGYWDCWDVPHHSDCPFLSTERSHIIFEEKPLCNGGCFATERESFVIVYSVSSENGKYSFKLENHHHISDFESEYVDPKQDNIEDYRIYGKDILAQIAISLT